MLKDAQIKRLEKAAERLENAGIAYANLVNITSEIGYAIKAALSAASSTMGTNRAAPPDPGVSRDGAAVRAAAPAASLDRPSIRRAEQDSSGGPPRRTAEMRSGEPRAPSSLGKGQRAILSAIAQHFENGVTRDQLSVLTGYRRSTRDTYVQRLREAGLAEQNGDARIRVTTKGARELGDDFQPLPTGDALLAHWLGRLTGGELALFEVIVQAYPKAVHRDVLSEKTEYARSSRDTYLQRLIARKLVSRIGRGEVRAAEELFV